MHKTFAITDILKIIGDWKTEFERVSDIENINNNLCFQHLIGLVFYCNCETSLVTYNHRNRDRMQIKVCKCNPNITVVQVDLFEKYKRTPYYHDSLFLYNDETPLANQRILSECVLNDSVLLEFFRCDGEIQ